MNGAFGDERYGFSSTERTVKSASASPSASARARSLVEGDRPCRRRRRRSLKSLPVASWVPSTATSVARRTSAAVAVTEVDVPVVGGDERDAFALALDDQADRRALHAAGGQPAVDTAPQHGRHLVAIETVEDAAGLGGVDEAVVEIAWVVDGVVDGRLGDLVEHHPLHGHLRLEVLEEVPRDRLALAVFVGREIELAGVLQRGLEILDDGLAALGQLVGRLEPVVDVDVQSPWTAGRRRGRPRRARRSRCRGTSPDRLRLGGRLHDDEGFGHRCLSRAVGRAVTTGSSSVLVKRSVPDDRPICIAGTVRGDARRRVGPRSRVGMGRGLRRGVAGRSERRERPVGCRDSIVAGAR